MLFTIGLKNYKQLIYLEQQGPNMSKTIKPWPKCCVKKASNTSVGIND